MKAPIVAVLVGTFVLWITAKGELGAYWKLATTKRNGSVAPAPAPSPAAPASGSPAGAANGVSVPGVPFFGSQLGGVQWGGAAQ